MPISVGLLAFLLLIRGNTRSFPSAALAMLKGCALIGVMSVLSYWVFRAGGYRSLLAVLGVLALTLPFGVIARHIPARACAAGLALGVLAGAAGSAIAMILFKGIYVNFALAFACCSLLLFLAQQANKMPLMIGGLGAYVWLIIAAAGVALGWGGVVGIARQCHRAIDPHRVDTMERAQRGAAVATQTAVARRHGRGGRAGGDRDSGIQRWGVHDRPPFLQRAGPWPGALQHWRDGIGMLATPADWLLGKGPGRFPRDYLFQLVDREFPGGSSIGARNGEDYLVLSGPRHEVGFGEVFRVAQRVSVVPGAPYSVVLDVQSDTVARLHFELCERQLLYVEECAIAAVNIPATGESWQRQVVSFDGAKFNGGPWYAPRPVFFAMATESPGTRVAIDNVSLIGPDGGQLLVNGDFAQGMTGWFTTSDRFHLPWHIKNLGLNVLFDQGIIGLLLFAAIVLRRLVPSRRGCSADTPVRAISRRRVGRISAGGAVRQPAGRTPPRISLLRASRGEPCAAKRRACGR